MPLELLLGVPAGAPEALNVARVVGTALLAIGQLSGLARYDAWIRRCATCWQESCSYDVAVMLAYAAISVQLSGILLWPAVQVLAALAVWSAICLHTGRDHHGLPQWLSTRREFASGLSLSRLVVPIEAACDPRAAWRAAPLHVRGRSAAYCSRRGLRATLPSRVTDTSALTRTNGDAFEMTETASPMKTWRRIAIFSTKLVGCSQLSARAAHCLVTGCRSSRNSSSRSSGVTGPVALYNTPTDE